jgi:hypothetical protein
MARRGDYGKREAKKPRRGTEKGKPISELVPQPVTEVIKKRRKPAEEHEE